MSNQEDRIISVNVEDEMKAAYIDYAMSVIVSRALPDVRDGLKPVHRRVLYGMNDLGLGYNKPQKKSARIVGEVLGKYHPHGDGSVYDAMVRMAQEWSLRYPLVDGQGNFGSVDGDSPAAMRYTEARLKRISDELLGDIDKNTVDFRLNFDDSLEEPSVLPSKIPNLLINGASGIAVGMATNMLPHNLSEVVDGTIAFMENPEITIKELMEHIKAPDFPTYGIIHGVGGIYQAYETGKGRVVVRAKADIIENKSGRTQIIVSEIPYQVNKATLIEKTAAYVNDKKIEGISSIRDESDRKGMRIVYDIKRDANPTVVLNMLYKHTALQTSYTINNVCLVKGRPRRLNLKELIHYFVEFRHEVIVRRTQYELDQAEKRAHILEGLLIAIDNLDEVIAIIRKSRTPEEARNGLIERFSLSEIQARAILDMRLQKLTGLERDKVRAEYDEIMKEITRLKSILGTESMRVDIIKGELLEMKERYGDERRTQITFDDTEMNIEDLIDDEEVVVTISHLGYIKRTKLEEYREQNRGGKGAKGGGTRDEDFIEDIFMGTTHNYLLFFTNKGRCHWLRVYNVPEGTKTSKGRPAQNLVQLDADEKIMAQVVLKDLKDEEFLNNHYIVFATRNGIIKKTSLKQYSRIRKGGINGITIRENDELIECKLTDGNSEILLASRNGKLVRFNEQNVSSVGRTAIGVKGMTLGSEDDYIVGMVCLDGEKKENAKILALAENGYGKRTEIGEYRLTNRGAKGVKNMNVTEKTGKIVAIKEVTDDDGLMIINKSGLTIRMAVEGISTLGRATQGVRLIKLKEGDQIASVAKLLDGKEDPEAVAAKKLAEMEAADAAKAPDTSAKEETPTETPTDAVDAPEVSKADAAELTDGLTDEKAEDLEVSKADAEELPDGLTEETPEADKSEESESPEDSEEKE